MDGKFKIVAVLQGQPLFTGNRYRLLSIYTGEWWDLPLTAIMQHGFKIQLGRVFVPTALDYPVFSPYDGLSYELPFIPEGRKVPSRNDTVIVLGENRRGTEVQGYWVTDYQAQIHFFDIPTALSYADVGYWNAEVVEGRLSPKQLHIPSFPVLSL